MTQSGEDTPDADRRMLERVYELYRNPNALPAQRVAMLDEVSQYLAWRGGDGNERRPGAPKSASPDARVMATAKAVADGVPTALTRDVFEDISKHYADADRQPGETVEQARARFHQTPDGRLLREAAKRAQVGETIAKREIPLGAGPAMIAMRKRADEIASADRISRSKAVEKLAERRDPLFAAAQAEERGRAVA